MLVWVKGHIWCGSEYGRAVCTASGGGSKEPIKNMHMVPSSEILLGVR